MEIIIMTQTNVEEAKVQNTEPTDAATEVENLEAQEKQK